MPNSTPVSKRYSLGNVLREWVRRFKNRPYASADDLYRKRTCFGELNEFFGRQIISSDRFHYSPPFFANPFRAGEERAYWEGSETFFYEYNESERRVEAERRYAFIFDMLKDRISPDDTILDVGCNRGYYLEQWHKKGFRKLYGLEPQRSAVEYVRTHRPFINVAQGTFGPRRHDMPCDVLLFFQSISRVPYRDRLFDAIDRVARKYVFIWEQESLDDFVRDYHVGLAKKGFVCIDKRVVNRDYIPIGFKGADGPMIEMTRRLDADCFQSHALFRRVEIRA